MRQTSRHTKEEERRRRRRRRRRRTTTTTTATSRILKNKVNARASLLLH
jgi:hypothetical protein